MKRICVVGTGYVGLVTGACLAGLGNQVTCLDVIPEKIARLRAGELPIYEPGLEALVARNVEAGRLLFMTSYAEAIAGADFIFIAVGTPALADGGGADMRYVEGAARSIAEHLTEPVIIVTKSTMPVGGGRLVSALVREHLRDPELRVEVVANPEFLREGSAVQDFLQPDRVVIGASDRMAAQAVARLYSPLGAPIMITDLHTAEMIKYASNAFLATKISFINEMAHICERLGADIKEVADGMGYDRRIGRAFLDAGLGYGGSCFPKDVSALMHMAAEAGLYPRLLNAVTTINHEQRYVPIQKLEDELGGPGALRGKTIALLGLTFKANTDDLRDAPSLDIIRWLLEAGVQKVRIFDPVCTARALLTALITDHTALQEMTERVDERLIVCCDEYDAAHQTDGIILVTEWAHFRELNLTRLRDVMRPRPAGRIFVDGRNLFDPADITRLGFCYLGIGRTGHSNYQPSGKINQALGVHGHTLADRAPTLARARVAQAWLGRVGDLLSEIRMDVGPRIVARSSSRAVVDAPVIASIAAE